MSNKSTETEELVKVVFELSEPDMGVSGESLWAALVGENLYELRNSPWHARNVNWLDIVEALPESEDQWPKFARLHKRSGHRTIHIYILGAGQNRRQQILDDCNQLGSTYENMDSKMCALDFGPEIDITPALEYLESSKNRGLLDWRINDYD